MKKIIGICGLLGLFCVAGCAMANEKQQEISTEKNIGAPEEKPADKTEQTGLPAKTEALKQEVTSADLTVSVFEEKSEAKEGEEVYFTSCVYYPVYEGTYADKMNSFVTALVEKFRYVAQAAEESAAYDYREVKEGTVPESLFPEKEEFVISCVWETEQWQVLLCSEYSDVGGAHPNVYAEAYVVDVTTGAAVGIERVLEVYGVTKEELAAYAALQIQREHGEELYAFDDTESALREETSRFLEENQWYLKEEGLVLFANPYEIAPYVYGTITCEIPYGVLEEGLKK